MFYEKIIKTTDSKLGNLKEQYTSGKRITQRKLE